MDGLPVTIRLLDPPLHEFLPDRTELAVQGGGGAGERGEDDPADEKLLAAVERLHESNPMLGLRGVRLGLVVPGLFAHAGAGDRRGRGAADQGDGGDPQVEIMVPLVGLGDGAAPGPRRGRRASLAEVAGSGRHAATSRSAR